MRDQQRRSGRRTTRLGSDSPEREQPTTPREDSVVRTEWWPGAEAPGTWDRGAWQV